jgi:hypothetical protein
MAFCVGWLGCNSFFLHTTVFNLPFHSIMCTFSVLDTIPEPRPPITPPERAYQSIASDRVNPEWHELQSVNFVSVSVQESSDFAHDDCSAEKNAWGLPSSAFLGQQSKCVFPLTTRRSWMQVQRMERGEVVSTT